MLFEQEDASKRYFVCVMCDIARISRKDLIWMRVYSRVQSQLPRDNARYKQYGMVCVLDTSRSAVK